ncbi:hypothetical protein WA588_004846 [Blastocystis sp. NMH]
MSSSHWGTAPPTASETVGGSPMLPSTNTDTAETNHEQGSSSSSKLSLGSFEIHSPPLGDPLSFCYDSGSISQNLLKKATVEDPSGPSPYSYPASYCNGVYTDASPYSGFSHTDDMSLFRRDSEHHPFAEDPSMFSMSTQFPPSFSPKPFYNPRLSYSIPFEPSSSSHPSAPLFSRSGSSVFSSVSTSYLSPSYSSRPSSGTSLSAGSFSAAYPSAPYPHSSKHVYSATNNPSGFAATNNPSGFAATNNPSGFAATSNGFAATSNGFAATSNGFASTNGGSGYSTPNAATTTSASYPAHSSTPLTPFTAAQEYFPPTARPASEASAETVSEITLARPAGDSAKPLSAQPASTGRRRGRRHASSDESSPTLPIDPSRIRNDPRTTLMIRNIPNSFTQDVVLRIVNGYIRNRFDFFYLPIDFKTQCNLGYCYINVLDVDTVLDMYNNFHNKHWPNTVSNKTCQICYARIQGKKQMMKDCDDWAVMHLADEYRPLFYERVEQVVDGEHKVVMKRVEPDLDMRMK